MTLRNEYVEGRGSHQNPEITVAFLVEDLFWRSHQNPDKTCGIFPVCFGVHKTEDAQYLS